MKIQAMLIIIISMFFSCATQAIAVKRWFPDNIIFPPPIAQFMNDFSTDDIDVARNAYLTVLVFIEELNDAHHENLARAYRLDTPTEKRAALIDGELTIIESSVGISYLMMCDDDLEECWELGPSPDALTEIFQITYNSLLYNKLLDHWLFLTGELLGEQIDVKSVWEKLIQEHESLHKLGFIPFDDDSAAALFK
jgi:hypothetical protein